jgi:hypothetical protein
MQRRLIAGRFITRCSNHGQFQSTRSAGIFVAKATNSCDWFDIEATADEPLRRSGEGQCLQAPMPRAAGA